MTGAVTEIKIPGVEWEPGKKVRKIARVGGLLNLLVIVTPDGISAFDVVLPNGIPWKGKVLNQLTIFWKGLFRGIIPNDIVSVEPSTYLPYLGLPPSSEWAPVLKGRTILAHWAEVVPVECVVRGYITGSLWNECLEARGKNLQAHNVLVHGQELPGDLKESSILSMPIFTPATKSSEGHDINLSYKEMVEHLGVWLYKHPDTRRSTSAELLAQNLKSISLALYLLGRDYAKERGIIIADTKFEFGFINGKLCLIDEVLTPDSSRFWDAAAYSPGKSQQSFDKQFVRDWLVASGWNKEPPAPQLPPKVVAVTTEKYLEAYTRLTGQGVLF